MEQVSFSGKDLEEQSENEDLDDVMWKLVFRF